MLTMIGSNDNKRHNKKSVFLMDTLPYKKNFDIWKNSLGKNYDAVRNYVENKIMPSNDFSAATMFPKRSWDNTPLMFIINTLNDEEMSAWFLGLLIMDIIMQDIDYWFVTKTNFTGRDFETCYYWRA